MASDKRRRKYARVFAEWFRRATTNPDGYFFPSTSEYTPEQYGEEAASEFLRILDDLTTSRKQVDV